VLTGAGKAFYAGGGDLLLMAAQATKAGVIRR